ncbi:MAG: VPLPA-CTERM sorting domain-containing protein [Sneathiella sp.]
MKTLLNAVVGAVAVSFLFVATAQSAVITVEWDTDVPPADTFVPTATSTSGTVYQGATGSVGGVRRSPWDTIPAMADTGTYTSVSGDASATYELTSAINSFTFMWGSVDDYNMMEFWNGDEYLGILEGSDAQLDGAPKRVEWINATITLDMLFDKVRFVSGNNAFEYANVELSVVPLPAALPLYGAGLAALGFMGWRHRRKAAATA